MMKIIKALFAIAVLISLCACDSVTSSSMVGEKPVKLVAAEWDGTWISAEAAVNLKVEDAEKGHLRVAWIEESGGQLKTESFLARIRSSGDWQFGNIEDDGEPEAAKLYLFMRIKKEKGQIIAWTPDLAAFTRAVKSGKLPGEMAESSVRLEALGPEQLEYIKSGSSEVMFDWDEPLVLVRVGE